MSDLTRSTDISKVALIVDREDFLNDIREYREELGLSELISREKLRYWYFPGLPRKREELKSVHQERVVRNMRVQEIIQELIDKYKLENPEYGEMTFAALLTGKVQKEDLKKKVIPVYTTSTIKIKGPQLILAIYPNTTQQDLIDIFKSHHVQQLLRQQEDYTHQSRDPNWNEIKKIRKWYWWNVKGMSYSEIAKKEVATSPNTVGVMLSRYKRALSKPLT